MIGLDTNVIVRYLVQDDAEQANQATCILETMISPKNKAYIAMVVLCELIWVLESCYHYPKTLIGDTVEKFFKIEAFKIEEAQACWVALSHYRSENVDFSDALIGYLNRQNGCEKTFTFDKKAAGMPYFELLIR